VHGEQRRHLTVLPALLGVVVIVLAGCSGGSSGVHTQSVQPAPSTSPSAQTPPTASMSPGPSTPIQTPSSGSSTPSSGTAPPSRVSTMSSASNAPSPWPTNFTNAQQNWARAALTAFAGFIKVSADAEAAPAAKNWNQTIRRYAADPTAAQTLDGIASLKSAGVHAIRTATYTGIVVKAADGRKVVLQACVDGTDASLADSSGKVVALKPSAHPRTLLTFNVFLYPAKVGGWLISETMVPNPVKPC
jgi:cytoskeletal protein RodZ